MSHARRILALTAILIASAAAHAEVVSETLVFLNENGRDYTLQRAMRSDRLQYDFFVAKQVGNDRLLYVHPNEYQWDDSDPNLNRLHFNDGNFVVMYPNRFDSEVTVDDQGVYTYKSWDGKKQPNGHFGSWNSPDNFSRYAYAWIIPENIEIVDHQSNREGDWVARDNSLSFFARDTNDLTFTIRYRQKDSDADGVIDRLDRCPDTASGIAVDSAGCEIDDDSDGVVNSKDQCPHTLQATPVDARGCALDADKDGVADARDACPETPVDAKVDLRGCPLDSDNDGVANNLDQCPNTGCGIEVDKKGCERDTDADGVVDAKDQCPETQPGTQVAETGCPLDSGGDGVADQVDLCPATQPGTQVDATGCDRATAIVLEGVNFHTASAELTDDAKTVLDRVAASLLGQHTVKLEIGGHTDATGGAELNRNLSQARAESVRKYLIQKGVAADMLTAVGYGEERPVADNTTAEGRQENRRVELSRVAK